MIWRLFKRKTLDDVLGKTKTVKVEGIYFKIKKLDPLAYMTGSSAIFSLYQTYEEKRESGKPLDQTKMEKMRAHYIDVFMESVEYPKLSRKATDDKSEIFVENLLKNWDLANGLYEKIVEYTYGKKNLKFPTSQKENLGSSI